MSFIRKYRPSAIKQIIGNRETKVLFTNFMDSWALGRPVKKALFLYGHSGNGKNALIESFCEEHDVPISIIDPCEYTDSSALLNDITEMLTAGSFEGSRGIRIIVIDGIEFVEKTIHKKLFAAIRASNQPVVLIGGAKEGLVYTMRRSCMELFLSRPTDTDVFNLLKKIVIQEHLNVGDSELLMICKVSMSVRTAIQNLESLSSGAITPEDLAEKQHMYSTQEQVTKLISGETVNLTAPPDELAIWVLDNGASPDIVGMVDVFLGRTRETGMFKLWKYSYMLLGQCRAQPPAEYPRMFIQMNQCKIAVSKEQTKINKVKAAKAKVTKKEAQSVNSLADYW